MREIKFRSWNPREKIMEFPDHIANGIDGEKYQIMQFTGIKDKQGKEIYDGDVVNLIPDGYTTELAQMCWDEEQACWIYRRISDLDIANGQGVYPFRWGEVEVIGNIYENPEILVNA